MADQNNRGRNADFKKYVATYFQLQGIPAAVAPVPRPSEVVAHDFAPAHLTGIDGWRVCVQSAQNPRPGEALDNAREAAKEAGVRAAVVINRAGVEAGAEFVLLSLEDFGSLLGAKS